jgi:hypothetical protein
MSGNKIVHLLIYPWGTILTDCSTMTFRKRRLKQPEEIVETQTQRQQEHQNNLC